MERHPLVLVNPVDRDGQLHSILDLVTRQELDELTMRIKTESMLDHTAYFMELLKAVLCSEDSVVLFTEILDVIKGLLHNLIRLADWKNVNALLETVDEAKSRTDLPPTHQAALSSLLESLHEPACIWSIESALNAKPDTNWSPANPLADRDGAISA